MGGVLGGTGAWATGRPSAGRRRGRRGGARGLDRRFRSGGGGACTSLVVEDGGVWRERSREVAGPRHLQGAAPSDYYELLGVECGASFEEVKAAYRGKVRIAHPDVNGGCDGALLMLLGEASSVLLDQDLRQVYDAALAAAKARKEEAASGLQVGYTGVSISGWGPFAGPDEGRAVFVDEATCIGCMSCTQLAPDTFFLESDHGRARVQLQWGNALSDIEAAIGSCPVDCIHVIPKEQLPLLEHCMVGCPREDIAMMARRRSGNLGAAPSADNPFQRADDFVIMRERALNDARRRSQSVRTGGWGGDGKASAEHAVAGDERAAAIGAAWLAAPPEVRTKGWPEWHTADAQGAATDPVTP